MIIPTRVHTALRFDRIPIIGAALGLEIKRPCSHPLSIVALGSMTTRNQVTTLNWAPPPDAESVLGAQIGSDDTHALAQVLIQVDGGRRLTDQQVRIRHLPDAHLSGRQ